jgi:hypothetical protein
MQWENEERAKVGKYKEHFMLALKEQSQNGDVHELEEMIVSWGKEIFNSRKKIDDKGMILKKLKSMKFDDQQLEMRGEDFLENLDADVEKALQIIGSLEQDRKDVAKAIEVRFLNQFVGCDEIDQVFGLFNMKPKFVDFPNLASIGHFFQELTIGPISSHDYSTPSYHFSPALVPSNNSSKYQQIQENSRHSNKINPFVPHQLSQKTQKQSNKELENYNDLEDQILRELGQDRTASNLNETNLLEDSKFFLKNELDFESDEGANDLKKAIKCLTPSKANRSKGHFLQPGFIKDFKQRNQNKTPKYDSSLQSARKSMISTLKLKSKRSKAKKQQKSGLSRKSSFNFTQRSINFGNRASSRSIVRAQDKSPLLNKKLNLRNSLTPNAYSLRNSKNFFPSKRLKENDINSINKSTLSSRRQSSRSVKRFKPVKPKCRKIMDLLSKEAHEQLKRVKTLPKPSKRITEFQRTIKSSRSMINLRCQKITNLDLLPLVGHLIKLPKHSDISLNLENNNISDLGLEVLLFGLHGKTVKSVNLRNNKITVSGVEKFDLALRLQEHRIQLKKNAEFSGNYVSFDEYESVKKSLHPRIVINF